MPLSLLTVPGFADVPDSALGAESPALGLNLNRISLNAAFGMVRPEIFYALYKHGDQVFLPISRVDGYVYSQPELMYQWAVQSTLNPTSGWITGPDSLWYGAWIVDQTTGKVESIEYYRRSGDHDNAQVSNDGVLGVFTIAQRQQNTISVLTPANSWVDIVDGDFSTDAPLDQSMAQNLNRNAKFAIFGTEAIYMGEFYNGQTIPQPVSPADGYVYAYSQVKFKFSWRWTTQNTAFTQPNKSLGQLGPIKASINASTGVVTCNVTYVGDNSILSIQPTHGRIVVIAYCSRQNLIGTLPAIANAFAEINMNVMMPGRALRAATLLQLQKNIREAACSCEFFGPATYNTGGTVPLPTSPIDGYAYSRDEITPVWEWNDTTNHAGDHIRVAGLWATISQTSGAVTIRNWRMPPGGPYVEDDALSTIEAMVIASRGAQHSVITAPASNAPGDAGTAVVDQNPPDINPYAIAYYAGQQATPAANEILLKHAISGELASVVFPTNLVGSFGGCITAPTGAVSITMLKGAVSIGTLNIAAGATTMTFSFLADITCAPGDIVNFTAPATPDATLKGLYFTVTGSRN